MGAQLAGWENVSPASAALGTEIKGSVLEFFREAILGVTVRMLLLSTGEKQNKSKMKHTERRFYGRRRKELVQKEDARNHPSQRTERSAVLLRKPTVGKQAC